MPADSSAEHSPRSRRLPMCGGKPDDAYRVLADMPGVRKEDINVTIAGSDVAVSAEVKRRSVGENEKPLLWERTTEKFYRAFTLEHEVDESRAHAHYADGVLELTLPKSPDSVRKRITVQ